MSWLPGDASTPGGASAFERVFALRPELHAAWRDFTALLWERRLVDPALLELARDRLGRMHGAEVPDVCDAMRAARAARDPARHAALDAWWESDRFDARERACLRFAEQFALDPHGIGDDDAAAVVAALGDAGLVAFVEALAVLDGFGRFARILDAGAEP